MLLPRVLTAALGIPLLLYLIHLGGIPFLVLVVGAAVLALYEYSLVLWAGGRGVQRTLTVVGGGVIALSVALEGGPYAPQGIGMLHLAVTAVLLTAVISELVRRDHSLDRAALSVFGALLIGWTLGHLFLIRDLRPNGKALTYLLFVSIWVTDSFAYFTGNMIGRRKLARVISPKKTWEGAIAGTAGAVLAAMGMRAAVLPDAMTPLTALGLGLLIGVVGQLSDLGQSLVKRAAGAKDSASLLPGHGGVFDRMDSFLMLAPLFYYVLLFR